MFKSLPCLAPDPTFKLFNEFKADPNPEKVNLGIGLYFDPEGKPVVLPTVKKAFSEVDVNDFNYQPIGGNRNFLEKSAELFFGKDYDKDRLAMQATCGGTQAARCFADLAIEVLHAPVVQIATPTWVNYYALFKNMEVQGFDHCTEDGGVNFEGYLAAAKNAPEGSAFLIQGGLAHNPSGVNLSLEQLKQLIDVLNTNGMLLFMDMAYFGLGEGIEKDREYVRACFDGLERFAMGVSFSKNASLYEHRCGALFVKTMNGKCVESQLQKSIRETISVPPGLGQEVMLNILTNHRAEWEADVEKMRLDIDARRKKLVEMLPEKFARVADTRGMFGLLPLALEQVKRLRSEFGIYLLDNGRINFAGVREQDMDYIARAIKSL